MRSLSRDAVTIEKEFICEALPVSFDWDECEIDVGSTLSLLRTDSWYN